MQQAEGLRDPRRETCSFFPVSTPLIQDTTVSFVLCRAATLNALAKMVSLDVVDDAWGPLADAGGYDHGECYSMNGVESSR